MGPMLRNTPMTPNVVVTDMAAAKRFYVDALGLELAHDMGQAMFLRSGGQDVFVYQRDTPSGGTGTLASFHVKDLRALVEHLVDQGIQFDHYDGMDQDELGIAARGEDGPWAAWCRDPDGNIIGFTQFPS